MSLDPDRIRQVASGYRLSQLVYACPSLGVPDVLLSGPATADNVADTIGAVPGLVSRLLRAAASEGVVDFAAGRYQLNDFSRQLCSAPDGPMREFVLGWSTLRTGYLAFGYLDQAIKSGHSGVELLTGQCFHEHLRATSEEAARYAAAMEETGDGFRAVAEAYHFGRYRRIVDVGGGQGTFPIAIRQRYPNVSGVLFDLPDVVAWAPAQLAGYPEAAGITVTAGDMFVDIPEGGDAYLFSTVLRCFTDAECLHVLRRCAQQMAPGGHLLAVEMIMPNGIPPSPASLADLQALVVYGGQDRTEHEWTALITEAALDPPHFHPAVDPYFVIDAALPGGWPTTHRPSGLSRGSSCLRTAPQRRSASLRTSPTQDIATIEDECRSPQSRVDPRFLIWAYCKRPARMNLATP